MENSQVSYFFLIYITNKMFLEDVGKRVDIRYFNNYDKMDKALKQNIESLPKIINDNLVQV